MNDTISKIRQELARMTDKIDSDIAVYNIVTSNEKKILQLTAALKIALRFIENDDCYCSEYPGKEDCYKCNTITKIADLLCPGGEG